MFVFSLKIKMKILSEYELPSYLKGKWWNMKIGINASTSGDLEPYAFRFYSFSMVECATTGYLKWKLLWWWKVMRKKTWGKRNG